jgi:hypothetical protein
VVVGVPDCPRLGVYSAALLRLRLPCIAAALGRVGGRDEL